MLDDAVGEGGAAHGEHRPVGLEGAGEVEEDVPDRGAVDVHRVQDGARPVVGHDTLVARDTHQPQLRRLPHQPGDTACLLGCPHSGPAAGGADVDHHPECRTGSGEGGASGRDADLGVDQAPHLALRVLLHEAPQAGEAGSVDDLVGDEDVMPPAERDPGLVHRGDGDRDGTGGDLPGHDRLAHRGLDVRRQGHVVLGAPRGHGADVVVQRVDVQPELGQGQAHGDDRALRPGRRPAARG